MIQHKKAQLITTITYSLFALIFFTGMVLFILNQSDGEAAWAEYYAKEIVKVINAAQPGDEILLDIHQATRVAQKKQVRSQSEIIEIDNPHNKVCVKLSRTHASCYEYVNDVDIINHEITRQIDTNVFSFHVREARKNA